MGFFKLNKVLSVISSPASDSSKIALDNQVIGFQALKGGDGATTLAVNTAAYLANRNDGRVLLIDTNILYPMVPFYLKCTIPQNRDLLSYTSADYSNLPYQISENLFVIAASNERSVADLVSPLDHFDIMRLLIESYRDTFKYIIIDIGSEFSEIRSSAMFYSDVLITVVGNNPVGQYMSSNYLKNLSHLSIHEDKVYFIVSGDVSTNLVKIEYLEGLITNKANEYRILGYLPFSLDIVMAGHRRELLTMVPSKKVKEYLIGIEKMLLSLRII